MEALKMHDDLLLDDDTDGEIARAIALRDEIGSDAETSYEWEPSPEDENRVEGYLRALRYYRVERDKVAAFAKAERDRIDEWERKHLRKPIGAIAYLEHMLRLFSEAVGKTKRVSPNGTLSWRKGRERVVVDNGFCERYQGTEFVRKSVTVDPDKTAIKKHIADTGEIPEGADIVRGDDTFVVDVEHG